MKSLGFKPMTCLSYRNKTAQLHKVKLFSTCSWSQDTLPLISLKNCNHHWKSMSSSTLLLQSTVCVEGPFMALVWCEIFGWCLTDSRCLTAGQWHAENQQDTGQTHTQMHAKLWSVPAHYFHAPECAWQLSVWTTRTVFKPLATLSVQTQADYSWTVIFLSLSFFLHKTHTHYTIQIGCLSYQGHPMVTYQHVRKDKDT